MRYVIDLFWPRRESQDFLESAKQRAFAGFCLIGGITSLLSGLMFALVGFADYPVLVLMTTIGPLAYLLFPVLVTRGVRFTLVRDITVFYSCSFIITTMILTGGVMTRAPYFLIAGCILASYLYSWRTTLALSIFTVFTLTVFHFYSGAVGSDLSVVLPNLSYQEASAWTIVSLCWMMLMCVGSSIIFLFEMNRAAEQLREARIDADAANRAKSEFLANMSHEIRTPMNGVLGMTELLRQTELSEKQETYANTIDASGNALLSIINDILDFSKIEAGHLELDPTPFAPHEIVEDTATLLGVAAHRKDIELITRIQPDFPKQLLGDGARLRQALINIVGNAVKFTHQGHVLIDLSGEHMDDHMNMRIDITDTGIGIPPEKIEAVFNQFTQAESSTTRKYGGTGLGLTITRQIIRAMGGDVTATSSVGKGSTFSISLSMPIVKNTDTDNPATPYLHGLEIAVVDDNPVNRQILQEQLSIWGATPLLFDSAATALAALHGDTKPPALALIDYHMPEMDGLELIHKIRGNKTTGDMPVIVLSSVDDAEVLRAFREAGVVDTIPKPVRKSQLERAIAKALSRHSAQVAGETVQEMREAQSAPFDEKTAKHAILVAEDNEVNRMVISGMIDDDRYAVDFAEDGRVAYRLAKQNTYDAILMDISMPEMDGVEATKAIRSDETSNNRRHTPIIALTAHAMNGDRDRFLAAGMDDYLGKPIKKNVLEAVLEKWISFEETPTVSIR